MLTMLLGLSAAIAAPPIDDVNLVALGSDKSERMTVQVRVDGSAEFPFIVDTGAERTVVSRQLADHLKLAKGPDRRLVTVSGEGQVKTVILPSIEMSGAKGKRIEAPALEQAHLGAPGMLGIDSLQSRRVTLDFRRKEMRIVPSRRIDTNDDPDTIVVSAHSRFGQLILVDSSIDGRKIQVIVDTGAQTSIGNLALLERLQAKKGRLTLQPVKLISVSGGALEAQFTQIPHIKIGGADMTNVPVAFADAEPFRRFGLANRPALLLGMDALRLFDRVSVDFANKQVKFLLPDSSGLSGRTLIAAR